MTQASASKQSSQLRDLVVRRQLGAPVAAVWRAFTEDDEVMKWWGPEHFTAPIARMDVREGGKSIVCMRSPDGHDMYSVWQYTCVVPGQKLEYVFNLSDPHGNKVDPTSLGMPSAFPRDVAHVVTFEAQAHGASTELVVVERGYGPGPFYDLSKTGLEQCLDKLERVLSAVG
jgi:uncharacterized protein YndB with AHSA1/START domain